MMFSCKAALVLLLVLPAILASNILVVVPVPARSHWNLFAPLAEELANKGHQVTFVSGFPLKKPVKNLKEVVVKTPMPEDLGGDKEPNFFEMRHFTPVHNAIFLPMMISSQADSFLNSTGLQGILKSNQKFDAIIVESFLSESIAAGLAYKYKVPLIGYATFMPSYWNHYMVGNEAPSSYIPDPFITIPYKMNFGQRFLNYVFQIFANTVHGVYHIPTQDAIMRRYFGNDLPPVREIMKNTSLLLVNDHYALSFPRPTVPNLINIGGLHVKPPKPLPADLQKYLDESKNGVILFSMGSNLKSAQMGEERIQMFLNAFAKLEQNVLWKFEKELTNKPKNVRIMDWLPQSDILAHPNIKVFITHGGLLGTTESVDRGVPVVGLPIFGDQPMNMKQSVNAGVGLILDFDNLKEEDIYNTIKEVISNPKYAAAAKQRSKALRDVITPPLQLATWWIEYIIRTNGAPHLRSARQDLKFYETYQIDVIATLAVALFVVLYVIKASVCALCRLVCGKKKVDVSKNKKQK